MRRPVPSYDNGLCNIVTCSLRFELALDNAALIQNGSEIDIRVYCSFLSAKIFSNGFLFDHVGSWMIYGNKGVFNSILSSCNVACDFTGAFARVFDAISETKVA